MFEGCSPEPAGEPLEAPGDGVPRWMVATRHFGAAGQDPAYTPTRPPAICKTVKRKTPTGSVGVFFMVESCQTGLMTSSVAQYVAASWPMSGRR